VKWKVDNASILKVMDIKAEKLIPSLENAMNKCIEKRNHAVKLFTPALGLSLNIK
jgi:hypothetical protein